VKEIEFVDERFVRFKKFSDKEFGMISFSIRFPKMLE
jgi:hypothetical protein